MLPRWLLLTCFCILFQWNVNSSSAKKSLDVVYEWKYLDYDFGSDEKREEAIKSGEYNYKNAIPIDVDKWKDLTFITVIRDSGVPSSLNIITDKVGPGGHLLKPYPDWSWAKLGDCDSITSVYRVAIDKCDRLWVLDNGLVGNDRVCGAQLLTFDLNTSKLLKRIKIPEEVAVNKTTGKGLLVTPVIDTHGENCEVTNVFISDPDGHALIYYDGRNDHFTRLESSAFVNDPKYTKYTIEGESFNLEDGIVGMALSKQTGNLYFSPMSSHTIGAVLTCPLERSSGKDLRIITTDKILKTQSSAKAISKKGTLFYGLVGDTSIGCWNEHRPASIEYNAIAAKDRANLQFTSGLKVIKTKKSGEELWALTNKYQQAMSGTMNFNDENFRILKGNVNELVEGTVCEPYRGIPMVSPIWLGPCDLRWGPGRKHPGFIHIPPGWRGPHGPRLGPGPVLPFGP